MKEAPILKLARCSCDEINTVASVRAYIKE